MKIRPLLDKKVSHREACERFFGRPRVAQVRLPGPHTAVFAPTGAGKMKYLLGNFMRTCPDSVIFADQKSGEAAKLFADYRREHFGHRVIILDPEHVVTDKPDTLYPIQHIDKESPTAFEQCAELVASFADRNRESGDGNAAHFVQTATSALTGVTALVVAHAPPDNRSFQTVIDIVSSKPSWQLALQEMARSNAYEGMLARRGASLAHLQDRELASTMTTVQRLINCLSTPSMARSSRASTFDPVDVIRDKATIFLVQHAAKDKDLMAPVMRLWITTLMRAGMQVNGLREVNEVHFVIDDAHQIGHIPPAEKILTVGRGMGLRLQLYFQNAGQLDQWPPGCKDLVLANTSNVFFGTNTVEQAKLIHERLGSRTVLIASGGTNWGTSSQGGQNGGGASHSHSRGGNDNWAQHEEPLLRVSEVLTLPPDIAISVTRGVLPIWTTMKPYWHTPTRRGPVLGPIRDLVVAASILVFSAGLSIAVTAEVRRAGPTPAYRPMGASHGQAGADDGGDGSRRRGGQGRDGGGAGRTRPTVGRR